MRAEREHMTRRASAKTHCAGSESTWIRRPSRTTLCRTAVSLLAITATISVASTEALAHETPPTLAASTDPVYVVKAGDYLAGIANKLNVTLPSLLAANHMTISSLIVPGNQIVVPSGATLPTAAAQPAPAVTLPAVALPVATLPVATETYVVRPGDFLIDIAAKNGVTLKALLAANKLFASSVIVPGRILALPPATLAPAPPITPVPSPAPTAPTAPTATVAPTAPASLATVVAFLHAQIGKPYEFNTAGPDSYDCSGLVRAAYLQIGISLPHQSLLQSRMGASVDWRVDDIRAGDLVFAFSTGKNYISHVGIAISSTQWISASQTGVPVRIGTLPVDDRIQAVRRIVSD